MPGGKIELGETTLAAAERELKEETGLKVELHPWAIGSTDVIVDGPEGLEYHYVLTHMFGVAEAGAVAASGDDATAVRWATRAEVDSGGLELGGDVGSVLARAEALIECGALSA